MGQSDQHRERDERVSIPLTPEDALRALLQVKPDEPAEKPRKPKTAAKSAPRSEKRADQ